MNEDYELSSLSNMEKVHGNKNKIKKMDYINISW
jgi:hypothetical protein